MINIIPVRGIPDVERGDDIGKMIIDKLRASGEEFQQGDIAIVSQKIVSKSEGRIVSLSTISPSEFSKTIAKETGKDPRHVEVILQESS